MITASDYRRKNAELLAEYEYKVRQWLMKDKKVDKELADRIPFFKDGVVCPEKWFADGNGFRPLFILKEVSLGKETTNELDDYFDEWGHGTTYEFVENPFNDIRIGTFAMWKKIAALAKGLESVYNGNGIRAYNIHEFDYETGGEAYTGSIKGYLGENYRARTNNDAYNDTMDRIAVLNVKKIGGGISASCPLSKSTLHYSEHIQPFETLICRQIELIHPTVVICCSREFSSGELHKSMERIKNRSSGCKWLYGYHPTRNSTMNFYMNRLIEYEDYCHRNGREQTETRISRIQLTS